MVYCGRCGNSGHYISYCPENYNRDGERISKHSETENSRRKPKKEKANNSRKGQIWTAKEEEKLEEYLISFIESKSTEFKRSENAIYARVMKILEEMSEQSLNQKLIDAITSTFQEVMLKIGKEKKLIQKYLNIKVIQNEEDSDL